jgi:phosphoglucomutase
MSTTVLYSALEVAVSEGCILESTLSNIKMFLGATEDRVAHDSVVELVEKQAWSELNDRFFQSLKFGTGGLRGRTAGKIVTRAERGVAKTVGERPEFPCVGTNSLNYANVAKATRGLLTYAMKYRDAAGTAGKTKIVLSYDTRHFSPEFAEYAGKIAVDLGVDVYLMESCRSTPQLSFAVRYYSADVGVMFTASHNPPHDNGFKAYFNDGASVIDPHATEIIKEVNAIVSEKYEAVPEGQRGKLIRVGKELDEVYLKTLKGLMLRPEMLQKPEAKALKIVYTALHGTGGVLVPNLLKDLGFNVLTVAEQDVPDGNFTTVDSPNPENAAALKMAVDLANAEKGDLVIGTDPDCDRMGVGARDAAGQMRLLTGNMTGSLMAWYRIKTMFELGILNDRNKSRAKIVKTFVTSPLQDAIAKKMGVGCVNTLTGFKWIGNKLTQYEEALPAEVRKNYRQLSVKDSREARLKDSTFFIFGGEESYGYLGDDVCRDKDGNGAVVMFAELAVYAALQGKTVVELLDDVYAEFGYFLEVNYSKTFEGAEGAAQIAKLAKSYAQNPPSQVAGVKVKAVRDFQKDRIVDEEGQLVSKEPMIFIDLEDGRSFAVRPSGTEPKIKYYLFGSREPSGAGKFVKEELAAVKVEVSEALKELWAWIDADIGVRIKT